MGSVAPGYANLAAVTAVVVVIGIGVEVVVEVVGGVVVVVGNGCVVVVVVGIGVVVVVVVGIGVVVVVEDVVVGAPATVFRPRFLVVVGVLRVSVMVVSRLPLFPWSWPGTSSACRTVHSPSTDTLVDFRVLPSSSWVLLGHFPVEILTWVVGACPFFVTLLLLHTLDQRSLQTAPLILGFLRWPCERARVSFSLLQPLYVLALLRLF